MSLFTPTEMDQIAAKVASIEESTAGELVVGVVGMSDAYMGFRALLAGVPTLLCSAAWILAGCEEGVEVFVVWQTLIYLGVFLVSGLSPVLRFLSRFDGDRVEERAFQMFAERGVYRTQDASGVLILLSVLERRVVILGDSGIDAKLGADGWNGYVQQISEGIRSGRALESLLSALEALGLELAASFPPREGDTNELDNAVVVED